MDYILQTEIKQHIILTSIYFIYIWFISKRYWWNIIWIDLSLIQWWVQQNLSLFPLFLSSLISVIFFKPIYIYGKMTDTIGHIFLINDEITEKFIISTSGFQALLISLDAHLHQKERKFDFRKILIFSRNDFSSPRRIDIGINYYHCDPI